MQLDPKSSTWESVAGVLTAHGGRNSMGDVLEFTGEYYTRVKRSKEMADALALNFVEYAQEVLGMDISSQQFTYDMAWVMKFTEVLVDNEMGVANRLSTMMESLKTSENRN